MVISRRRMACHQGANPACTAAGARAMRPADPLSRAAREMRGNCCKLQIGSIAFAGRRPAEGAVVTGSAKRDKISVLEVRPVTLPIRSYVR